MDQVGIAAAFEPAKQSVSWAKDAVNELHEAFQVFLQADKAIVVTEIDPHTKENVQKFRFTDNPPAVLSRKANEALTVTKSAFDQAAFAARNIGSGASNNSVYYPWAKSPTDLAHLLASRGFNKHLWSVFQGHEPYPRSNGYAGGDDIVRAMATLANKKHTVGLGVAGTVTEFISPEIEGKVVEKMVVFHPRWNSDKNEAELMRWKGDIHLHGKYKFRFEVVLKHAGLPFPVNAIGALSVFVTKANNAVETLQAACLRLAP